MKAFVAVFAGCLFGFGLSLSGMTDPQKVIGFLDVAGRWDPSLAFVMGSGLLVTLPGFWLVRRRGVPLLEKQFFVPTRSDVDARLLVGASLFGIGWGIAGFCPGPAIANLSRALPEVFLFFGAMLVGMWGYDRWPILSTRLRGSQAAAAASPD